MKLLSLFPSISIVLALVGLEAADVAPRTERPTGEYRVARLQLNEGLRYEEKDGRSPQIIHLAFRDEKLANWWFIGHGWHAVQQHDDSLHLTDKRLGGALELRCYDVRGRLQDVAKLTFQVTRSEESLQGKVGLQLTGRFCYSTCRREKTYCR